jgi:hypothetical protein
MTEHNYAPRRCAVWDKACRESLKQYLTWDGAGDVEAWAERAMSRLDRLYLNTTMSESEYSRYVDKIDRQTMERVKCVFLLK